MKKIVLAFTSVVILTLACAGGPEESGTVDAPDWVTSRPSVPGFTTFVANGSAGDAATAESVAFNRLRERVTTEIGTKISVDSLGVTQATLDTYEVDITETVRTESEAQISDLSIEERFETVQDGQIVVYLLGLYDTQKLEAEKDRIQRLLREQIDAIIVPEQEGDFARDSGDLFIAITKYIQAASAAFKSEVQNANIYFERNMNKTRDVIQAINIVPLNPGIESASGQAFTEDFEIKVVNGATEDDPGVPNASLRISYRIIRSNGRAGTASDTLKTDASGMVSFRHPVPTFTGNEELGVRLDLQPFLETLVDSPQAFQDQVFALEDLAARNRASIPYSVVSNAKNVPTAVLILDGDQTGQPLGTNSLGSAILGELAQNGFAISLIQTDASILVGKNDPQIIAALEPFLPAGVERIIVGTGLVTEPYNSSNRRVRVNATVKVLDVNTGAVLFSDNSSKRGQGSNEANAVASAYRQLGEDLGADMVNELP